MTMETPAGAGRILLVEDDPMIRALTAEWVEAAGFEVVEAGSGREAMEGLRGGEADYRAAILDLTLPDTDGQALARDLRRVRPELPVLFATGNPDLLDDGVENDPDAEVLRKPYSTRDLHEALGTLLDGAR